MSQPDGERIAKLEAEVAFLKDGMEKLLVSTHEISKTLSEARGGWKTLMLVAGIASTVGALLVKAFPFLYIKG